MRNKNYGGKETGHDFNYMSPDLLVLVYFVINSK